MTGANIGTLLGNFVGASLCSALTEEQLRSFGWRIPFLSGILIVFAAAYLQLYGTEHHPNAGLYNNPNSGIKNPLEKAFLRENALVRGGTGPLAPTLQISLFCVVKFHVFFAVCNTWFFRKPNKSPYRTNLSTSPTTYRRTNAIHYILIPMLIASGTARNTLFCMPYPRRF